MKKVFVRVSWCLFLSVVFFLFTQEPEAAGIRIGIPNDSGGLIFHYLFGENRSAGFARKNSILLVPLQDCCTTSTEWALSGDRLDMAVLCPDAARRFLEKDPRFENFGSLLVNADVLILRPGRKPKKIAVSGKRDYQLRWIRDRFGVSGEPVKMNYAVVPFAYERNLVDGAVVDILKAVHLKGDRLPLAGRAIDLTTHLLVGRKNILTGRQGKELAASLEQGVRDLNDPGRFKAFLQKFAPTPEVQEEVRLWNQMRARFILPEKMKIPRLEKH